MVVDLKKLDEKIRKLQQIRELAADPEMATLLTELVGGNGNTRNNGAKTPENTGDLGDGRIGSAEKAVRLLHSNFTTNDVKAKMEELGYKFAAKDPSVATYSAMILLRDKGIIKVVEKG